ncbi:MAG: hypothetical protein KAI18_03650 [Candidatus Aenigmarchaeota archaeon]|nr:hypothetical protein [Candidatus Aenigmarchaeota archaeon]
MVEFVRGLKAGLFSGLITGIIFSIIVTILIYSISGPLLTQPQESIDMFGTSTQTNDLGYEMLKTTLIMGILTTFKISIIFGISLGLINSIIIPNINLKTIYTTITTSILLTLTYFILKIDSIMNLINTQLSITLTMFILILLFIQSFSLINGILLSHFWKKSEKQKNIEQIPMQPEPQTTNPINQPGVANY